MKALGSVLNSTREHSSAWQGFRQETRLSHKVAWKNSRRQVEKQALDFRSRYKSDEVTFTSMANTPKGFKVPAGGKVVRDSDLKCRHTSKGLCSACPRLGRVQL